MEDMVWWNNHWYPLALENDGTSSNNTPDAHHLLTTILPHLIGDIDRWFPCACACPALKETEDTQPDYLEKLGWKKGIGEDDQKEASQMARKVDFDEKVQVMEFEVANLNPRRAAGQG